MGDTAAVPARPASRRHRSTRRGWTVARGEASRHILGVQQLMKTECPHRDTSLRIGDMADMLHVPVHVLSQIINDHFESSFTDYVNEHRVEEAKRILADPSYDCYTLVAIAHEAGFASRATFNRVFKKLTGLTPSHYRRFRRGDPGASR